MDRDAEIAELRREIEILRARHALFAKWGRILKVFFTFGVPLFAVGIAIAGVELYRVDMLSAVFFVGLVVVLSAIICMIFARTPENPGGGWIDLASPPIRGAYPPRDILSFVFAARPSDALIIEAQIAVRERRLNELGIHS